MSYLLLGLSNRIINSYSVSYVSSSILSSASLSVLPKTQQEKEEERQSDAKVNALLEETSSGGAPPARNSASVASRPGSQETDPMFEFNNLVTRAHEELDMLVSKAQSKRQD